MGADTWSVVVLGRTRQKRVVVGKPSAITNKHQAVSHFFLSVRVSTYLLLFISVLITLQASPPPDPFPHPLYLLSHHGHHQIINHGEHSEHSPGQEQNQSQSQIKPSRSPRLRQEDITPAVALANAMKKGVHDQA